MQTDERDVFGRVASLIEQAQVVAVSGHTDPDGDALGSVLALTGIIEARWPGKRVQPLLANDRPVDPSYRFLPGSERLLPAARYAETPDLFISVDTPSPARLADAAAVLRRAPRTAAFDHHPTMEPFAQVNFLRACAASVGDIVHDFMAYLGVHPTPEVALCILTAVMTDTGRFQYQNTDAHALRVAADMVEAGAHTCDVAASVYQSYTLPALRLREQVFGRLATDATGQVAFSYVTQDDLARLGATAADCDGLIDDVRCLAGVKACLFMREQADGALRGNLRSKVDGLDVSAVAQAFGGGGHRAAAGYTVQPPLKDALARSVELLAAQVARDCGAPAQDTPGDGAGETVR